MRYEKKKIIRVVAVVAAAVTEVREALTTTETSRTTTSPRAARKKMHQFGKLLESTKMTKKLSVSRKLVPFRNFSTQSCISLFVVFYKKKNRK